MSNVDIALRSRLIGSSTQLFTLTLLGCHVLVTVEGVFILTKPCSIMCHKFTTTQFVLLIKEVKKKLLSQMHYRLQRYLLIGIHLCASKGGEPMWIL